MRNYITAQGIANDIRMTRSQFTGSFMIVEGETADLRVYRRFISPEFCQIIPAHGKENAIQSLEILEDEGFAGIFAIVDADFWRIEGVEPLSVNIFITDSHDLETMILKSPALEKLLDEFGSTSKIASIIQQREADVRQILLDIGRPIGYFRWISQRYDFSLTFNDIVYSQFINNRTLVLGINKMISTVKNKSSRHDLDEKYLQNLIDEITDEEHDSWDVCSGHDLVRILSLGLRRTFGSNQPNEVRPEMLEKFLRTGYEAVYFYTTQLYQSFKNWESSNSPFQILPNQNQPQSAQS